MNEPPDTKMDVIRSIETERVWWHAVVDMAEQSGPVTGDEPIDGEWTFRDVIEHINGWRRWAVARLEAASNGAPPVPPWPARLTDTTEEEVDEINAWFLQQGRAKPLSEVVAEAFSLLDRMQHAVEAIPDDRLLTPGVFAETDPQIADYPIGPALVGFSMMHVHIDHAAAIQGWLSERIGQHAELPPTPSDFGFED